MHIDFTVIIIGLVLLQLFVLNINVKTREDLEEKSENIDVLIDGKKASLEEEELTLVVHRSNGEEKSYSKKTVA